MPLKVNEFVIQAKVNEDSGEADDSSKNDPCGGKGSEALPDSQKQEIIDQCFEMMKEYIERDRNRF